MHSIKEIVDNFFEGGREYVLTYNLFKILILYERMLSSLTKVMLIHILTFICLLHATHRC